MASDIFEPESFVVRPPVCFPIDGRIAFQAIALSVEVCVAAIAHIQEFSEGFVPLEDEDMDLSDEKTALYSDCWNIVDQVHALIQLLRQQQIDSRANAASDFVQKYRVASTLRNKMDHLGQNIDNLAKAKVTRPHVFGALAYFRREGLRKGVTGALVEWGTAKTLPLGSMSHDRHDYPIANPAGKELVGKICLLEFHAFGERLPLQELASDLRQLASFLDDTAHAAAEKIASAESARTGKPVADYLARPAEFNFLTAEFEAPG